MNLILRVVISQVKNCDFEVLCGGVFGDKLTGDQITDERGFAALGVADDCDFEFELFG